MSNGIFSNFTGGSLIGNYDSFKDTPKVDYNPPERKKTRKDRYRDAVDAASKFKDTTDYKARKEAKEKENARAQRATMKISDDISVMEGFTDEPFTFQGQEGTRGRILGGIGSAVGGYFGGPLGGQIGGTIGSAFG